MIRAWMWLLGLVVVVSSMPVHADALCAPPVIGVQGGSPPGGPDWFAATPVSPFGTRLTDPRWVGASSVSFDDGTGHTADFRALLHRSTGVGDQDALFLSWRWVAGVDAPGSKARLVFGFANGLNSSSATVGEMFRLVPGAQQAGTVNDKGGFVISAWSIANDGTPTVEASPTWGADARMWTDTAAVEDAKVWGVSVKLPLPNTTGPFSFFYELRGDVGAGNVRFTFPSTAPVTNPPPGDPVPAAIAGWADLQPTAACTAGISLAQSDIGIMHGGINTSTFKPGDGGNDVFADALNGGAADVPAGALHAKFRIAKWGAAIGDTPSWQTLTGGDNVTNTANVTVGAKGRVTFNYALTKQDNCDFFNFDCGGLIRVQRNPDQCVQVELSGSSLVFAKSSAGNNMRFVSASVFEEQPTLNVSRLPANPNSEYDIYFLVERVNMPAAVPANTSLFSTDPKEQIAAAEAGQRLVGLRKQGGPPRDFTVDEKKSVLQYAASTGARSVTVNGISTAIEDVGMPTFKVHVYQEAGTKTQLPGGTQSTDLIPGVGFGYYVRHEGTLSGWTADLVAAGAVALAPNLYKLHVGTAPVSLTTRIEAKAPGASPAIAGCNSWFCQWWVIALIALAGLALLILIIRAVRRP